LGRKRGEKKKKRGKGAPHDLISIPITKGKKKEKKKEGGGGGGGDKEERQDIGRTIPGSSLLQSA